MLLALTQGFLVNMFVLFGVAALGGLLWIRAGQLRRTVPAWAEGLLYGVAAVVVMMVPACTSPGVMFDCRSAVTGVAGLFGGPVAALCSLPLACEYRLLLAGPGVAPGLLEIVLPAALGSFCHLVLRRRRATLGWRHVLGAGAVVILGTDLVVGAFISVHMSGSAVSVGVPAMLLITTARAVAFVLFGLLVLMERRHHLAVRAETENERRMLHSQKMAALGQLAGRIAHATMNGLAVIDGSTREARNTAAARDPGIASRLDAILATVERLSRTIGQIVTFSVPQPLRVQPLPLGACLVGIEELLAPALGADVKLTVRIDADAGDVAMDPELLQQALLHLATNARDAMPRGGSVTIAAQAARLTAEERERLQAGMPPGHRHRGSFAVLSLADTGCGMDPELVPRIFEPYFTTKEKRENAGLGLATVYNIVQRHGGAIDVRTNPGRGTTFLLYLPVVE